MNSDKPEGALRLYRRGWRSTCQYSGTASRHEFWWFTLLNFAVFLCATSTMTLLVGFAYSTSSDPRDVTADFGPFFGAIVAMFVIVIALLVPWTSLLVRRARDATASNAVAYGVVAIGYVGLAALPLTLASSLQSSDPLTPWFLLAAVLGWSTVVVVSALPTREQKAPNGNHVVSRAEPQPGKCEDDDPWAR